MQEPSSTSASGLKLDALQSVQPDANSSVHDHQNIIEKNKVTVFTMSTNLLLRGSCLNSLGGGYFNNAIKSDNV